MRVRVNADNAPQSPGLNADPDHGELLIESFASGANPTAEVIGHASQVVAGASYGCTLTVATGLITINRPGVYKIGFDFGQVSAASASGVIEAQLQKNAANLSNTCLSKVLQPAVAANFMSMCASRILTLAKNDTIRVVLTGTVGGVITVTRGSIYVVQLSDTAVTHE